MKAATRAWVRKAEADYRVAHKIAAGSDPFHDAVCFHCQQCAEKYLKGLLEELGLAIPHTHILKDLLAAVRPHHPALASLRRGLTFLTRFAVTTRYPGDTATKRQATSALRWAGRWRDRCWAFERSFQISFTRRLVTATPNSAARSTPPPEAKATS